MNRTQGYVDKLVLGTAQLGLDYGINNMSGKVPSEVARRLLELCLSSGVNYIDTASVYGDSEEVIGSSLVDLNRDSTKVITKLNIVGLIKPESRDAEIIDIVDLQVSQSMQRLRTQKLDCLLLHRASDLLDYNSLIWERLLKLQRDGVIERLGVSVQTPEELTNALSFRNVEIIQLPLNILDHRWQDSIKLINEVKQQRNLLIHARSIFLQGLLLSDDEKLWCKANCQSNAKVREWLHDLKARYNKASIADLCITYIKSLTWVDGLVMGMETIEQFEENIALLKSDILSETQIEEINSSRPRLAMETLNPAKWNT